MKTVILGLGSSLGDKLANLRLALRLLKKIKQLTVLSVSPIYRSDALLPENAPTSWNVTYFNLAIKCKTSCSPEELLVHLKNTELKVGRKPAPRWAPRIIDIDILCFADLVLQTDKLKLPHPNLTSRPFALWPLADLSPMWRYPLKGEYYNFTASEISSRWGSRFAKSAPFRTQQIAHRIDIPEIMAILNLTDNSFSFDGKLTKDDEFFQLAESFINQGATILDIGAEATNPQTNPIYAETELLRLKTILPKLIDLKNKYSDEVNIRLSLDSRHPKTVENALEIGIDCINDVSGFENSKMLYLAKKYSCKNILMHSLTIPADKNIHLAMELDPVAEIIIWAKQKIRVCEKQGILAENIIFDPGIGFGKTAAQSIEIINRINEFKELNLSILIGHSRKSFLEVLTPNLSVDRDLETNALSLRFLNSDIDLIRIHNVDMFSRLARSYNYFNPN